MKNSSEQFVYDAWYVAGWDYEFGNEKPEQRLILEQPIVLYRKSNGKLVALTDRCVHRQAPLSMGRIEGDSIRCMYHGLRFSAQGKCVEIPGQSLIPEKACVNRYPVVERGSWVWVWMGDPEEADPALIPPVRGFDDPEWVLRSGQLDYHAPYHLINDNLLDLSHLAYVHANSFGATAGWSSRPPKTSLVDRGVRVDRWIEGAPPVPPLPSLSQYDSVDLWVSYEFYVPGVFIMYTAMYKPGSAELFDHDEPQGERLFSNFTCQAVTPVKENYSCTFFSWGPGSEFGGEEIAEQMIAVAKMAFKEDKVIIEAQAKNISLEPDLPMMPTAADKSIALFNKEMEKIKNKRLAFLTL
ncbi:aromatic ring-hydroxylating dioxygenase subunit alpha [Dasania marina]|uniref:aromatic ring-hydroxylating dioxygenase subunit alpha n=1 Tax=Dasania marina TaxID=471499 RepID=UPI00035C6057|nr:aromatic ring-hydroxylating dioxygenase subunit alpha [Dasania marina]